MKGATMEDAATINKSGERTVPSIQYRTVLITKDPMAKVIEYYKSRLVALSVDAKGKAMADFPRSVTWHEDSEGRSVAVQVITINTEKASTTLVISRGETESETHIAWTHYLRL